MRFVALISGGKDSVYSVIECERFGHELVCCGNLHPEDVSVEEIDSWMYQSAAHSVVPGVAECLGVPLVRCGIRGSAVCTDLNYDKSRDDEVEDLTRLLRCVLDKFPEVEAVSCGAILSTYQRNRVEDVCSRLGLISLAYLWQRDQRELLNEMTKSVEAVVVKTASMGLEPNDHLGKKLGDLKEEFVELHEKFGFHECGEGGEYESFVVDSARYREKRIVFDSATKVTLEDAPRGCGAVGILKIDSWHLECKERDFDDTLPLLQSRTLSLPRPKVAESLSANSPLAPPVVSIGGTHQRSSSAVSSGLISTSTVYSETGDVAWAMEKTRTTLARDGLSFADCVYAHLYVGDMSSFKKSNVAYVEALGDNMRPVPSRACVGVFSSSNSSSSQVRVDFDALAPGLKRTALNVRSISRWAPVCIGPYCQANVVAESIVFVAGQIALDPPTMLLSRNDEFATSMRHCDSILRACNSSLENVLSYIVYATDDDSLSGAVGRLLGHVVVAVRVAELPVAAKVEIQAVGVTHMAAPLFRRVDVSYNEAQCSMSASIADQAACVASLTLSSPTNDFPSSSSARLLVEACVYLVKEIAGLRFEHWSRLRVFVGACEAVGELQSAIETCLSRYTSRHASLRGPAISVIPAVRGSATVAHLLAFNFRKFEAERWIAGGGSAGSSSLS